MPRLAPNSVSWVLERVMLDPVWWHPHALAPRQQQLAVARHKVRHRSAKPNVAMQPKTAAHRVDHAVAPQSELDPPFIESRHATRRRDALELHRANADQLQATRPSVAAGAGTAPTFPP